MSAIAAKAVSWTETGLVPDSVIRAGIRRLLESKRKEIHAGDVEYAATALNRFVVMMNESPIALVPDVANEQHYEVPAEFFSHVMGDNLKYSCCYWPANVINRMVKPFIPIFSRRFQPGQLANRVSVVEKVIFASCNNIHSPVFVDVHG